MDVSEPASISSGIADRYATAVFEIANENGKLAELEGNLDDLAAALNESDDLRDLINNPLYTRAAQGAAITALAQKMELRPVLAKALGLMASKRRLFVLPQLIKQLRAKIADHKGEVTADVVSAQPLSPAQADALAATLKASIGKDIKVNATVDETLIGGLVVKVGSKMIDTSIRSKLNSLQNAMKEVG
ncbi:F0F1 ATP synthase subunit delta [Marinovum sp. 2_MG-2023]|uniref:F0F1 ATP synthase subunit delta n=1 Tax=unclassified Marinovum TaxID=2647166 RepID=UPI0026E1EF4F|nr:MULTISPECIES: F0F1 ATP synthase subunit delta [unclassified Marinovum]MDO6728566.1 F0F1 ATP synthase subunit delta [Marinovum sp. 2_MG-2023]MDO6778018.1 F0F1 ATP synthase subunit delta [Marinovum sp. 1_MG-2023]